MNGLPTSWVVPSKVTRPSSMTSRSADCVFGEARLISSARTTEANTGPRWNSNSCVFGSRIDTPVTSEGSRSGVNWIRALLACTAAASERASCVLPVPGTSSRSTWPPLSIVVTTSRITLALPTTATPTAETIFSKVSANHAACSGVIVVCCSVVVMGMLRLRDVGTVVGRGSPGERVAHVDPVAGDADGHPLPGVAAVAHGLVAAVAGEVRGVGAPRVRALVRGREPDGVAPAGEVPVVEGEVVAARGVAAAGGGALLHRHAGLGLRLGIRLRGRRRRWRRRRGVGGHRRVGRPHRPVRPLGADLRAVAGAPVAVRDPVRAGGRHGLRAAPTARAVVDPKRDARDLATVARRRRPAEGGS